MNKLTVCGLMAVSLAFSVSLGAEEGSSVEEKEQPYWYSVVSSTNKYTIHVGETLELQVKIRNTGRTKARILMADGAGPKTYRFVVFSEEGHVVLDTGIPDAEEVSTINKNPGGFSVRGGGLNPGREAMEDVRVKEVSKLGAGSYRLLLLRDLKVAWEHGFVVSNLVMLEVVEKSKEDKPKLEAVGNQGSSDTGTEAR